MQKSDQVCNQGMFHLGESLRSEVHMAQSSTSLKLVPSGCSGVTVPVEGDPVEKHGLPCITTRCEHRTQAV